MGTEQKYAKMKIWQQYDQHKQDKYGNTVFYEKKEIAATQCIYILTFDDEATYFHILST